MAELDSRARVREVPEEAAGKSLRGRNKASWRSGLEGTGDGPGRDGARRRSVYWPYQAWIFALSGMDKALKDMKQRKGMSRFARFKSSLCGEQTMGVRKDARRTVRRHQTEAKIRKVDLKHPQSS